MSLVTYSPPRIVIRNLKIYLITFIIQKTKLKNMDLKYPVVSEDEIVNNLPPLPWHLISWKFWHFRPLKSGVDLKSVTAIKPPLPT